MKWYSKKVKMSQQKADKIIAAGQAGCSDARLGKPRNLPRHAAERLAYINGYKDGQATNAALKGKA